jgi:dTDP-4-amino-4,6-dideoxygalactose transaminase
MDELQAAMLNIKLKYLDLENQKRREIARNYCSNIRNQSIFLPGNPSNDEEHVWHLYVVRTKKRDHFQNYLKIKNISTLIHYPVPPHKQQAFSKLNSYCFQITELIHNEVISLPIGSFLSKKEIGIVIDAINQY